MSAGRIDHAAEARDIIVEMGYPHSNADLIAYAQVHAMLALVEQQRISNRLALAAHELQVHGRVMVTDHGILDNPEHVDGYLNVKPEITAALS